MTSKLNQLTHHGVVRAMVGQSENTLDFRRFMDEGKIVLIRLPKGMLGEKALELLGLLIVGRIQLAALERANVPRTARRPFHLYIDECQNFVSGNVAAGLSEARKYGLHFILAHQHLAQLDGTTSHENLKQAILGNVANRLMFRLGVEDAKTLACYAEPEFTAADLQYLPDFRAVARILRDGQPLRPFALSVTPLEQAQKVLSEQVLGDMRARYAKRIDSVEAEMADRLVMLRQRAIPLPISPLPIPQKPILSEEKQ